MKENVLVGERHIEDYTFIYGEIDTDELKSINEFAYYGKIYSSEGFDVYNGLIL